MIDLSAFSVLNRSAACLADSPANKQIGIGKTFCPVRTLMGVMARLQGGITHPAVSSLGQMSALGWLISILSRVRARVPQLSRYI